VSAPERWLDSVDAPIGAREVLRAATPVVIPAEVHGRLALHATKLAATPGAGAGVLSTQLGLAGALGGAAIVAALVAGAPTPPSPAEPQPLAIPAPRPVVNPVQPAPAAAPAEAIVDVDDLPVAPVPKSRSPRPTLGAEAKLVGEMQDALARGDVERALSLARTHDRRFPTGQLRSTVAVLATRALERLGRSHDAKRRAAQLVEDAPSSVHAEEAERVLLDPSP
jgi:hypothetical protein